MKIEIKVFKICAYVCVVKRAEGGGAHLKQTVYKQTEHAKTNTQIHTDQNQMELNQITKAPK